MKVAVDTRSAAVLKFNMPGEDMTKQAFKKKILADIRRYHAVAFPREKFVPGTSRVPYAGRIFDARELVALVDSSLDFWLTAGKHADAFEKEFARFLGMRHCLLVNSGSSANLLAVSALMSPLLKERRLKKGDEVITIACGFPTTVNPIVQNGLVPVFVDVALGSYNICPKLVRKAVSPKTRAIIFAHTLGNPADMTAIMRLARRHKLWVIEDNCDALGAMHDGKLTGTFGHMSTYSFFPAHHMTMGEGGAVVTGDPLLYRAALSLRDWGRDCWCPTGHDGTCARRFTQKFADLPPGYDHKYVYSHVGYNLKATDMQAAIGCAQLRKLPGFIAARRNNFQYLFNALKKFEKYLVLPQWQPKDVPSWFGLPILVREDAPFTRAGIVAHLEDKKIATRMLFGGNLTKQPAYQDVCYRISGSLKNTDAVMQRLFWIGVYPGLTRPMREHMVKEISAFIISSSKGR